MVLNYKDLREELDDLLIQIEIPKFYWHQSNELKDHLFYNYYLPNRHLVVPIKKTVVRALEILYTIFPEENQYETNDR